MAKDEKKAKGFFGKITNAITGNESKPEEKNDIANIPPTDNGADNDASVDQDEKIELKQEPKKTVSQGPKSFSDMLRERTEEAHAKHLALQKKMSEQEMDRLKSDRNKIVNDNQTVNK